MICKTVLAFALVLLAALPAAPAELTATRLDGSSLTGSLTRWSNDGLVIATADGAQSIILDQLLSLRWSPAPAPADQGAKRPFLELVDGSLLPIDDYRVVGAKATATIATAAQSNQKEISIATRQVAAVQLQSLTAAVAPQWDEIRRQNLPSDVLLLIKRGGASLDYVEGVVGDVTADKIDFKMDGESTRADRALAAGMIYFRRGNQPPGDPRCIVQGRSGLRAVVSQAVLDGDTLRMKTISGVELAWPLADVHLADFSAGKIVYLSDLEPASERWTPLVALPGTATAAAAYGRLRRDQSPFGRPLALSFADESTPGTLGHERTFPKGLAIRSRMDLVYRLPAGYRRLAAVAGIDPTTAARGIVALTIQGDDRVLLQSEIDGNRPPQPIDLEIAGVRRLTIVVDYGRNLDNGDWLILGDARIVK